MCRSLNGLQVLSKCLKVQISSSTASSGSSSSNGSGSSLPLTLSMTLDNNKKTDSKTSKLSKIKAMEAKLKALERSDEFKLAVPGLASSIKSQKPYDKPLKKSK